MNTNFDTWSLSTALHNVGNALYHAYQTLDAEQLYGLSRLPRNAWDIWNTLWGKPKRKERALLELTLLVKVRMLRDRLVCLVERRRLQNVDREIQRLNAFCVLLRNHIDWDIVNELNAAHEQTTASASHRDLPTANTQETLLDPSALRMLASTTTVFAEELGWNDLKACLDDACTNVICNDARWCTHGNDNAAADDDVCR
jgi:hypothetical protein